ncbi:MAG: vWA domain-containing protein [Pseudomonadota bacterium]
MKKKNSIPLLVFLAVGVVAFSMFDEGIFDSPEPIVAVDPDWDAIAAWPPVEVDEVEAVPDPGRTYTVIVLDDSGSMGDDIVPARDAVVQALEPMQDEDRVAVVGLNTGLILPFSSVSEARTALPPRVAQVRSDGGTPLTAAMQASRRALEQEAARTGGFGTYRILITTDGEASNADSLQAEIEDLARNTPIQVATIGVGIGGNHILRRPDLASFVAIDNVGELAAALRAAIAEEQSFSAITAFEDG